MSLYIKSPLNEGWSIMEYTARNQICIVIPSLDPDQKLLNLLENLTQSGYAHIILVNDGSSEKYNNFFQTAKNCYHCHVLRHCINQGKGRALKTAFNYFMEHFSDMTGLITVDSDGQHQISDIDACACSLLANPDKLTLGCRDFTSQKVPFRSQFGNILTRNVFNLLCGIKISDTQTGLRAIPTALIPLFLTTSGERFEYEMNMLIDCKQHNISLQEVPIQTIYLEKNASSHFNPLLDSARIYTVFLKFIVSSLSSFVIDIVFFTLFTFFLKRILPLSYIFVSTAVARIISSSANYLINKHSVFKNHQRKRFSLLKYYTLATAQMLCSAFCVTVLHHSFSAWSETALKVIVDTILFFLSFKIQQNWVFRNDSTVEG